jgi:ribonucleoside-diphosphate reductase alpha chain
VWKDNTEEERLLGVSLTGILDSARTSGMSPPMYLVPRLQYLKATAVATNAALAAEIGIAPSAAISAVKPSGTVSQLVDAASGIHARHSKYYIRTVRSDVKDPITAFMKDQGIPWEPCVMQPGNTVVFSFPIKAPEGAVTRDDLTAIKHLELWLTYQRHWCEHKPSVTITYRDNEFMDVGAWVWKHLDEVSGISLLPHSDHVYKQAPYQECDEATYKAALEKMPKAIDWTKLRDYEKEDATTGSQELACVAGGCEI